MATYVDNSTQTIIAGLTRHPSVRPPPLSPHFDTTTPPDDMPTDKLQLPAEGTPAIARTHADDPHVSPTLLLRRQNRPLMATRISLPPSGLDAEAPNSPPPTEAVLSPLPAANKLFAGHTPIIPRSLSPLRREEYSSPSTPEEEEEGLTGPLTLPANPGDGTEDRIELKALDNELEKIAKERRLSSKEEVDSSPIQGAENSRLRSRQGSRAARRRSSADCVEAVDGVLLKKPKMNLGAPLGQV